MLVERFTRGMGFAVSAPASSGMAGLVGRVRSAFSRSETRERFEVGGCVAEMVQWDSEVGSSLASAKPSTSGGPTQTLTPSPRSEKEPVLLHRPGLGGAGRKSHGFRFVQSRVFRRRLAVILGVMVRWGGGSMASGGPTSSASEVKLGERLFFETRFSHAFCLIDGGITERVSGAGDQEGASAASAVGGQGAISCRAEGR